MYNREIKERLNKLRNEDIIWVIYILLVLMSIYSNFFERKYFLNNDLKSKEKYRKITIGIFTILIFVYLYFLKDAYDSLKDLKINDSDKKKKLTQLAFLGSLFIFISGIIFLYVAINDENIDVEIAFN